MSTSVAAITEAVESTPQTTSETSVENTDVPENVTSETSDPNELTRANVEALGTRVRLTDTDEDNGLDLFCYVRCNLNDDDLVKECRGVVFHGNELVLHAFPYTPEFNHSESDRLAELLPNFAQCKFYDSHEGALLRIFNFNGKWYISTHRKLNAFRSKWASRESFGAIFRRALQHEVDKNETLRKSLPDGDSENVLERFYTTLDVNKQYMFLVKNTSENRIVCIPPEHPTLLHVGTFVDDVLDTDDEINITRPTQHKFLNVDYLADHVSKMDARRLQGVIVFLPDNKQIKVLNKEYQDFFRARANEPSIKFRYLQVRMNKKLSNMLYTLYPEFAKTFDEYENIIYEIANNIFRAYVNRFINKRYVTVPTQEFKVIRDCHSWHVEDRANNRISVDKVIDVLNIQSPTSLNHMIRRYRVDQARRKEQHAMKQYSTPKSSGRTPMNTPHDGETHRSPVISPMLLPQNATRSPRVRTQPRNSPGLGPTPVNQSSPLLTASA